MKNLLIAGLSLACGAVSAQESVSIYEIQFTEEPGGESPYAGQTVETGGVVTAIDEGATYIIQNNSGLWQGLNIADFDNQPAVGDSIIVTGTVTEVLDQTKLNGISSFEIVSSGNTLPAPLERNTGDLFDEGLEGVLVRLSNAECTTATEFLHGVDDGTGDAVLGDLFGSYSLEVGNLYHVTGVVLKGISGNLVHPRGEDDIENLGSSNLADNGPLKEVKVYPTVANDFFKMDPGSNQLKELRIVDLAGRTVATHSINSGFERIDVRELSNGRYQVIVRGHSNSRSFPLIIE